MTENINLIIADDHPIVRKGMRHIIEAEPDLTIAAECDDGAAALAKISELRPAIAILDIDMPKMGGLEVLRALREKEIACHVIILTVHSDENLFKNALNLGAQGYVVKDSATEDIVKAIRAVSNGRNYASPALTAYLFKANNFSPALSVLESLTLAERRVLRLIADYHTNNRIAEELDISPQTVKSHRRNIAAQLGIEGSHALMKFALENKFKI